MGFVGKLTFASVVVIAFCGAAFADSVADLKAQGYKIIHRGTVTGYIDPDGKRGDDFQGCDFFRKLIIDSQYQVTCSGYAYQYAYRPEVVLMTSGARTKAVINGSVFDVSL